MTRFHVLRTGGLRDGISSLCLLQMVSFASLRLGATGLRSLCLLGITRLLSLRLGRDVCKVSLLRRTLQREEKSIRGRTPTFASNQGPVSSLATSSALEQDLYRAERLVEELSKKLVCSNYYSVP